jgi:hypothetical protein
MKRGFRWRHSRLSDRDSDLRWSVYKNLTAHEASLLTRWFYRLNEILWLGDDNPNKMFKHLIFIQFFIPKRSCLFGLYICYYKQCRFLIKNWHREYTKKILARVHLWCQKHWLVSNSEMSAIFLQGHRVQGIARRWIDGYKIRLKTKSNYKLIAWYHKR